LRLILLCFYNGLASFIVFYLVDNIILFWLLHSQIVFTIRDLKDFKDIKDNVVPIVLFVL